MLYGQELLNHINSQIDKYTELNNQAMIDNYTAKKRVLENKGFAQYGIINHIDKTITKEVVWITDKPIKLFNGKTAGTMQDTREFNSNINYWTGEQEEAQTIQLSELDFNITVLETIKTDNLTIEYILSNYKNEDSTSYFKITTNTDKVFYTDCYSNYFNTKGIKGIKNFKNEIEENIDTQEIFQNYQEKCYESNNYHQL